MAKPKHSDPLSERDLEALFSAARQSAADAGADPGADLAADSATVAGASPQEASPENPQDSPSPEFMARVLDQALSVQAELLDGAAPLAPRDSLGDGPDRQLGRQILQNFGGWPGLLALGLAALAGVWLAVSPPAGLDSWLDLIWGGQTDQGLGYGSFGGYGDGLTLGETIDFLSAE